MVNVTSRFTEEVVSLAESYCNDTEEPAAPEGGGRFPDYVMIPLHCLRIFLEKSYEMTIDLLENLLPIVQEIGLEPADLPDPSTLCKAFDRITIDTWRVLLRQSAQLHDPPDTPPSTPPTSSDLARASTTASGRIIAFRRSKRPSSSIRRAKRSSTCTVRQPNKGAMRRFASRSPAETRAICEYSPLTRATTPTGCARLSAN